MDMRPIGETSMNLPRQCVGCQRWMNLAPVDAIACRSCVSIFNAGTVPLKRLLDDIDDAVWVSIQTGKPPALEYNDCGVRQRRRA